MRRRLIPMNVVMALGLFTLISMGPDQSNPPKDVMERGKLVYEREGINDLPLQIIDQPVQPQALHAEARWAVEPKSKLIEAVLTGGEEIFKANRQQYQKTMPSLSHLSDRDIADMLTYVRNSFGNKAMTVTPNDVKKTRLLLAKKGKNKLS